MATITKPRIESIDILRGVVMVIMALDHTRDFFHITAWTDDPLNLQTTSVVLFFTRWITHFCAPIFVFLSGVSIYLQSLKKTKTALSLFIIKRGLWLIFFEIIIVNFGTTFDPNFHSFYLVVVGAIGISMVCLGLLIYLPFNIILGIGLLIVLGHNLLDFPESAANFKPNFWWDLLHHGNGVNYPFLPNHSFVILYPFVPWTGLMILGYCSGIFFTPKFSIVQRQNLFYRLGAALLVFFIVVRFINIYGDPHGWSIQKNGLFTLLSFIKVHKYPPSLMFMSVTIGIAFLFLAFIEKFKNRIADTFQIYGRTALFYYAIHWYVLHIVSLICFLLRGHSMEEGTQFVQIPFRYLIPGEGFSLPIVYFVWLSVVIFMYPLCKWYDKYKANNKQKWWLSYL
jgi:uncharacterized membrane protein